MISKLEKKIDIVAFCIFCAIMTYTVCLGVGNPLRIGGLSVWTLMLALFLVSSFLLVLRNFGSILRNPFLWAVAVFGAWIVFSVAYGFLNGNSIGIIIRDVSGLIYFSFFPLMLAVLKSKERIHVLMKFMLYGSFALSLLLVISLCMYVVVPDVFEGIVNWFVQINYLNFTRVSATIPRLLFVSMPFQVCGCAFATYFQILQKKINPVYIIITGTCLCAILLSFTRALYLSTAVAALFITVLYLVSTNKEGRKKLCIHIVASAGACLLLLGTLSVIGHTNYLDYAVKRSFAVSNAAEENTPPVMEPPVMEPPVIEPPVTEPSVTEPPVTEPPATEEQPVVDQEAEDYLQATMVSDQYRAAIKKELLDLFGRSPIIGNGMGIKLEMKSDWPEYSYLDLMAKTGIVGLLLYFLPILLMFISIVKGLFFGKERLMSVAWLTVMVGLMIYSIFQPFLNNVQCVLMYCCTLCVYCVQRNLESGK